MVYELTTNYLNKKFPNANEDIHFSDSDTKELVAHIKTKTNGIADYKDEIRDAFKDFLGSVARVSVFFRGKDKIAVKVLPKTDESALKVATKEALIAGDELGFIKKVVHKVCEGSLDFSEVTNRTWEATYLAHVKSAFYKATAPKCSGNKDLATEISLDIIRDNFAFLNDSLAEELLAKMIVSKKAETFLDYYGKTILGDGGIRFKTPDIIDRQGRFWQISTIRTIVIKYQKENSKALKIKEQADIYEGQLHDVQVELNHILESRDAIENDKVDAVVAYSENGAKISKLRRELGGLRKEQNSAKNDEEREFLIAKINKQVDLIELAKLQDNRLRVTKINAEKLAKERDEKEEKLKKKLEGIKAQLKSEEASLNKQYRLFASTKEAYEYIVDAVANALMKKKRVLG